MNDYNAFFYTIKMNLTLKPRFSLLTLLEEIFIEASYDQIYSTSSGDTYAVVAGGHPKLRRGVGGDCRF